METKINLSKTVAGLLLQKEELEKDIASASLKFNKLTTLTSSIDERNFEIARWEQKLYAHYRKLTLTEQEVADFVGIDVNRLKELLDDDNVVFGYTYFPDGTNGYRNFVTIESLARYIVEYGSM